MLDLGRTFLQAVERSPHAAAIADGDLQLSYVQWYRIIRRVALGLQAQGIARGDRLVVILQNRWEMATLHWACQFCGIVVTPVNWRAKPEELEYCMTDAQAVGVVFEAVSAAAVEGSATAQRVLRVALDQVPGGNCSFESLTNTADVDVDVDVDVGANANAAAVANLHADTESIAEANDLSLLLYTSGTTGKPKGVPRRHRHERAAALAHVAQNFYRRGERTLGVMPLYHTMGVRSLLAMALIDGLFVCVRRWNASQALRAISAHRITCLYLVPTLYHDLLAAPEFSDTDISSVTKLGFAGAPMNDALLQRLQATFKPQWFVNHYGSSEIYTVSINQDAVAKPGSAGRAGLNTRFRVVHLQATTPDELAVPGEEGQIAVDLRGDEAFEGYWRRPDADAKALRGGWYFSGDTGFTDSDGDLFVSGRIDDMIISGGENISPVDIESVLSLHPDVDEVAVAGLPDERWGQRVVAFIKRRNALDSQALDAYCRSSALVNFKCPREYIFVQEIPKSPVGKILRRKLSAGEFERDPAVDVVGDAKTE